MLVHKVSNKLKLLDPLTLKTLDLQAQQFWNNPFRSIANTGNLTLYVVLDVELIGRREGKLQLAEIQVAREADFGHNGREIFFISVPYRAGALFIIHLFEQIA